jgi:hypothetical protein
MWQQDSNSAEQLARGFADSGSRFAKAFLAKVQSAGNHGLALHERWRPETCAAIWAAITVTFASSHFSKTEQAQLLPMVRQRMAPFWTRHCGLTPNEIQELGERASRYLPADQGDDIDRAAAHIVGMLLDSVTTAAESNSSAARLLGATLSGRMLADLRRLDAINGRGGPAGLTSAPSRIRLSQANALRSLPRP